MTSPAHGRSPRGERIHAQDVGDTYCPGIPVTGGRHRRRVHVQVAFVHESATPSSPASEWTGQLMGAAHPGLATPGVTTRGCRTGGAISATAERRLRAGTCSSVGRLAAVPG